MCAPSLRNIFWLSLSRMANIFQSENEKIELEKYGGNEVDHYSVQATDKKMTCPPTVILFVLFFNNIQNIYCKLAFQG